MKNPKLVFAAVLAVVFCFAGYNVWSYFKEQQAVQAAEDLRTEQRRVERDAERKRKAEEQSAQRVLDNETSEAARLAEEARKAELAKERKEARIKAEAEAELRRVQQEEEKAAKKAQRLADRTKKARTLTRVPEVRSEVLVELSKLSPRYVLDKPEEFLEATFGPKNLSSRSGQRFMIYDGTNSMMLFAIIAQDTKVLDALIEIGMDVNAANEGGFTPLMFASAYASPEITRYLIERGADINAQAYIMDLNALHMAALKNPEPAMIKVLLDAGLTVESPVQNGYTPLQLAATDNRNLEVVEALIDQGADIGVYDQNGKSVLAAVEKRIDGTGDIYIKISDDVNARVLSKLK